MQIYNPITAERVNSTVYGVWSAIGGDRNFKGYRFRSDSPRNVVTVKSDRIVAKTYFFGFTLDEPSQGRLGLAIGPPFFYAEAPAKPVGNPPSTAATDHPGLFIAAHHSPPPAAPPF